MLSGHCNLNAINLVENFAPIWPMPLNANLWTHIGVTNKFRPANLSELINVDNQYLSFETWLAWIFREPNEISMKFRMSLVT